MKKSLIWLLCVMVVGCATPKRDRFDEGVAYLEKGETVLAQAMFEEALKERPDDPFLLNNLGVIYERRGNYTKALELYIAAEELNSPVVIESDDPDYDGLTISELASINADNVRRIQLAAISGELTKTQSELAALKQSQAAVKQQKTPVDKQELDEIENTKYSDIKEKEAELKSLYKSAYQNFLVYEYDKAMVQFKRFLELVPDNRLADNAQFWIGEIYYVKKDYFKALESFWKVITDYPDGNKIPDTLLRLGDSYKATNDRQSAKRMYKKLLESFPKTEAARKAGKRLAGL